jgi:TfoX/Sxy family transcriptional regulator of competence genes
MAFDEALAARIRQKLTGIRGVEEKKMMGGLTFMLHDKMCLGIVKDELMCRIDPEIHDEVIKKKGCRTMDFTNRPMKGFIFVDQSGMKTEKEFSYWIKLALDFNESAKPSKKKKR